MKQDKNKVSLTGSYGNFAGIELLSYFRKNRKNQQLLAPRERLLAFLNLDISSDEAIKAYITYYLVIPGGNYEKDIIKRLLGNFRTEHAIIKSIAQRASKKELLDEDISLLNKKLSEVKTLLKKFSEGEIVAINQQLEDLGMDEGRLNKTFERQHLATAIKYPYSFLQLYHDLYYYCLGKAFLRNCKFCGVFFHPSRQNQLYCDAVHKEKSREERRKTSRIKK